MKRILSVLLVLCMMISLSLTAKAEQIDYAEAENDSAAHTAVSDEDITAVGNNSIGAILATGLNAAQEEDAPTDDISNVVTDVKIRQGCFTGPDEALCDEAIVSFTAQERCRVVVGVYDDDGQEMLLSHKSNILDPGTQSTRLIFGSWYAKNLPNAEFNKKAADADEDGSVSILDATAIQRYLANLSTNQNIGKQIV